MYVAISSIKPNIKSCILGSKYKILIQNLKIFYLEVLYTVIFDILPIILYIIIILRKLKKQIFGYAQINLFQFTP